MIADAERGALDSPPSGAAAVATEPGRAGASPVGERHEPVGARRSRRGTASMDRLLFGDNQFFGVNHMSEEKARAQAMRFQDIGAIIDVLDAAYDEGVRTFMCTTHDRIAEVCDHVRADPGRATPTSSSIPCMPYAHKYANAVTEDGMLGAVKRFLPDEGLLDAAVRGGASLASKDIEGIDDAAGRRRDEDVRGPADAGRSSCRTWSSTCCSGSASTTRSGSSPTMSASATTPSPASSP